jgi:hypothetical protein
MHYVPVSVPLRQKVAVPVPLHRDPDPQHGKLKSIRK